VKRNTARRVKEVPFLSSALFTAYSAYNKLFPKIVETLVSRSGIFVPEYIERAGVKNRNRVVEFHPNELGRLFSDWELATVGTSLHLTRRQFPQVEVRFVKDWGRLFNSLSVHVERSYFDDYEKLNQLLTVLKDLYQVLHASYGHTNTYEMWIRYNKRGKAYSAGIDPKRGLPNIYWANFIGPEYVEMFGKDKIQSAPCDRVENLPDGGALLILTPSPFDFDNDREGFEKRRLRLKQHLGMDAFDPIDWDPFETPGRTLQGKVPRFRFLSEQSTPRIVRAFEAAKHSDMLSPISRTEWIEWLNNNYSLAQQLARDAEQRGTKLDFSEESLKVLDEYLSSKRSSGTDSIEFLKKLAAYLSQVVISRTGAKWSFEESTDLPQLVIGKVHLSPLARTQKILIEDETLEHWYQHLVKDLSPETYIRRPK